ncbi:MAG: PqqD family protein [Candidatus Aminicenantaceae bacterium]
MIENNGGEKMDFLEKCYQKDPDTPSRKIADEIILVPIRRKLADVDSIYLLRENVTLRIWELIDGLRSVREIIEIIQKEFDVSAEQAQMDIVEFFKQLEKIGGIIREVSKGEKPEK